MNLRTKDDLRMKQALPLDVKILMTRQRIRECIHRFGEGGVYVSFSGGKDSTVLLHLVREFYPDVEAVFVNTGLEFPEIQKFVKTFENVTILQPKMRFDEVIKKYGYPIISKEQAFRIRKLRHQNLTDAYREDQMKRLGKYEGLLYVDFEISDQCCDVMKKNPAKDYEKLSIRVPIIATMACESCAREQIWLKTGCNAFDGKRPVSKPMSFWTEQDVLRYIKENNLPIAPVYGDIVRTDDYFKDTSGSYCEQINFSDLGLLDDAGGMLMTTGCHRTGCIFCGFGCHLEKGESRFERLKKTHPRQYEYCIGGGEYNENGIWQPSKEGLGLGHVFDELNKLYGDGFIRY